MASRCSGCRPIKSGNPTSCSSISEYTYTYRECVVHRARIRVWTQRAGSSRGMGAEGVGRIVRGCIRGGKMSERALLSKRAG